MADGLQFDRAQFTSGNHCTLCQTPLQDSYYRLRQDTVCPSCAAKVMSDHQSRASEGDFLHAILFGLGAAVMGSIIYAGVALMTGFEFALIAILIGWMVGKAMMHGSNGVGGRHFQVVAVLLTYLSITGGYVPQVVKLMRAANNKISSQRAAGIRADRPGAQIDPQAAGTAQADTRVQGIRPKPTGGIGLLLLSCLAVILLAAALPFLKLASISGVLGIFIIFVGLRSAWRETAGTSFALYGPFRYAVPDAGAKSASA